MHFINLPFYLSVTSATKVPTCKLICTNTHRMQFCFHVYEAIVAALADEVIDCPTNRGKPGRTVANRGKTVTPPGAYRNATGSHRDSTVDIRGNNGPYRSRTGANRDESGVEPGRTVAPPGSFVSKNEATPG